MDIKKAYDFYLPFCSVKRVEQLDVVSQLLENHLEFETLEVIETGASQNLQDGCFGFFFCKLGLDSGGTFTSVDIDEHTVKNSEKLYQSHFPGQKIFHCVSDSVTFLQNYQGSPNLIHLDSWDLYVPDPLPGMLHGWMEFEAIKDKMPSGSICIIDDNFMKNTEVEWNWVDHGTGRRWSEIFTIPYEIVGKGGLIYHWAKKESTDWDVIGDHYESGPNIKVIVKKR